MANHRFEIFPHLGAHIFLSSRVIKSSLPNQNRTSVRLILNLFYLCASISDIIWIIHINLNGLFFLAWIWNGVAQARAHFNANIDFDGTIKNHFTFVSYGQLFALTLIKIHLDQAICVRTPYRNTFGSDGKMWRACARSKNEHIFFRNSPLKHLSARFVINIWCCVAFASLFAVSTNLCGSMSSRCTVTTASNGRIEWK